MFTISPAFNVKRNKKQLSLFNFPIGQDIGFELGQLGLPNDVKATQNASTNHASMSTAAVVSNQQPKVTVTQNTSQSLFVPPTNNATTIHHQNNNHRGFSHPQSMVTLPTPAFPSESLNIPSINLPPASNSPRLLGFSSGLVQNASMGNQMHVPVQPLQNVQNTTNLLNENVSNFADDNMDDSDDFIEGPLDKIVDQIMDRELNQAIMKTSAMSKTVYDQQSVASFPTMPSHQTLSVTGGLNTSTITKPLTKPSENAPLLTKLTSTVHSKSPFTLQPPGSTGTTSSLIRTSVNPKQASVTVALSSISQPTVPIQKTSNIEELLKIQQSAQSLANMANQGQFLKQHRSKAPGVLTAPLLRSPVVVNQTTTAQQPSSFSFNQNTNIQMRLPTVMLQDVRSDSPTNTGVLLQTDTKNNSAPIVVSQKPVFSTNPNPVSIKDTSVVIATPKNIMSTTTCKPPAMVSIGMQRTANKQGDMRVHISSVENQEPLGSPHAVLQPTSTKQNLSQVTTSQKTTQHFPFFNNTNASTSTLVQQQKTQKPANTQPLNTFQPSSVSISNPSQPALSGGGTILKITSPSTNILSGLQQPVKATPNVSTQFKFFNQSSPVLSTAPIAKTQSNVSPMNTSILFPKIQLSQAQISGAAVLNPSKSMVFTLAPGSQSAAAIKALPLITKDKLGGRQILLLRQPGQVMQTTQANTQNMKIVFVNEGSVPQVVCGVQKSTVKPSSPSPLPGTASPSLPVAKPVISPQLSPAAPVLPATAEQASPITIDTDSPAGSPSSNNSSESETIPIAALKQAETLKRKAEEDHIGATKKRGKYKKKDPNRPVKPLSSFMKFFQKTQVSIRQKYPSASFDEVTRTAKTMWENLSPKEKKVYQDEWRIERTQYKKALAAHEATKAKTTTDGPSPEKNNGSPRLPASPVDSPRNTSPVPSSPSSTSSSSSLVPPAVPHGSGKPLAMMMANKTKMAASAQSAGKVPSATSKLSSSKLKTPSNGVDDTTTSVVKKKQKINPIPKKPCLRESCSKTSKTTKERGTLFCSNECVMLHCRTMFKSWVETRRLTYKAAVS